jgi:hypothetical protein
MKYVVDEQISRALSGRVVGGDSPATAAQAATAELTELTARLAAALRSALDAFGKLAPES